MEGKNEIHNVHAKYFKNISYLKSIIKLFSSVIINIHAQEKYEKKTKTLVAPNNFIFSQRCKIIWFYNTNIFDLFCRVK